MAIDLRTASESTNAGLAVKRPFLMGHHMSLLLKRATVVTMNGRKEVLPEHDVLLEGDRIARIAPTGAIKAPRGAEELLCDGKIILPGFVSAHSHLSGISQRGLWDEASFESWSAKTFALDSLINFSPDEVYLLHCAACIECIRHGVTTVLDMFTPYPSGALDKVEAACAAFRDTGIRGILAYSFKDQSPDNQGVTIPPTSPEDLIAGARAAAERVKQVSPLVGFMLAPSAPQRCSDALLILCQKLAEELAIGVHTHLAETKSHAAIGRQIYGESMVTHLERIGFLNSRLSVAHAIWLEEDALGLLKKYDVKAVHNPASNMKLGSGMARVKDMIHAGLRLGLGADSANAGTLYSIFEQMKLAVLMPRAVWGPEKWVLPGEALEMATLGGASALLLDRDTGSLEEGKSADLVILTPSSSLLPLNNLIAQLVLAENGNSIETVIVRGRPLMLNKRIRSVNEDDISAQMLPLGTKIRDAHSRISA